MLGLAGQLLLAQQGQADAPRSEDGVRTAMLWVADSVPALLSTPEDGVEAPRPLAILLGDGSRMDGRSEVYARRLLGLGFAVLDVDLDTGGGAPGPAIALPEVLTDVLARARREPGIDPARVSVIGFGEGARLVLLRRGGPSGLAAVALLYPGCDEALTAAAQAGAASLGGTPVLLMHGARDPADTVADCARVVAALNAAGVPARQFVLPGAGYAWDLPRHGAFGASVLMPDPAGGEGRIRVEADPERAEAGLDPVLTVLLASWPRRHAPLLPVSAPPQPAAGSGFPPLALADQD